MTLFKKAEAEPAFLKMGIYGEAGSGKTFTASHIALGLALHIAKVTKKAPPPVMFLDTETGSTWVRPIFETAGIEFFVARTRSFADLKQAVAEAEAAGAILIADSMTHFWEEVREAFLKKKKQRFGDHVRLELPDWNVIKPEWGKFTTAFLNSNCHVILCGRAGNVYEFQENDNGKKEMITAGTRMASEKGMGYEPNILVEMTSAQITGNRKKKTISRTATVLKDRSTALDGAQFSNPTFASFAPHIKKLNIGGVHDGIDTKRNSTALFPQERNEDRTPTQRAIVLDEIQSLLTSHFPSTGGADRKAKIDLLKKHFNAAWTEIEKVMPLVKLRQGFDGLHQELEGAPSRYGVEPEPVEIDDEIPFLDEPKQAAE